MVKNKKNLVESKIIHTFLTYEVHSCPICKSKNSVIKSNWKRNYKIKVTKVSNYNTIILLDKQRFKCKCCNHTFIATSSEVDKFCNIYHNTVNRIIDKISNNNILSGVLPSIINIDEFKVTKDTINKIVFHIVNSKSLKTFNILQSRKSNNFFKYFMRFPRKQRVIVKFIVVDMFY